MSLKEKVENNLAIWTSGMVLAGFTTGIGAYQAVLRIAHLIVIPASQEPASLIHQVSGLRDEMQKCEAKIAEQAQEIVRLRRVAADCGGLSNPRTAYTVYISNLPRASEVVAQLKHSGFDASIYGPELQRQPEGWQGIWIGEDVPVQIAAEAIEVSRRLLPMLRYVLLYSDNPGGLYPWPEAERRAQRTKMFIGASNRGAAALKPLSDRDFRSLLDRSQSVEAFHEKIRSFYRP